MDGAWLSSNEYPQACDNDGNLNNYIDIRDPQRTVLLSDIDTITNSYSWLKSGF